jgi:ketosteroid isomerase-like protein
MSENLDLVRSIYADWERGDFSSIDWAHPEIEYVIADGPVPGRWTGVDGMLDSTREFMGACEDFRMEASECRELDDERVLVLDHYSGRGKTSGLEVGQTRAEAASPFQIRDGKVVKLALYWDRERAFAHLGLEE